MTKRIFRSICIAAIAVLLASAFLTMGVLYDYFSDVQQDQLAVQTRIAAQGVEKEGVSFFDGLNTGAYRVTWISGDGTVLYDSKSDTSEMENHLEREEIGEALEHGYGESFRYSATLMERSLYSAQRLDDGSVLRMSVSQNTILTLVLGMAQPICTVLIAAVILSLFVASGLSKKIVEPLNRLDLDDPLSNDNYDELAPVLRRIDSQQRKLRMQSEEMKRKQDEFDTVTGSMNEGLILINSKGTVLSINRAAAKLLNTDRSCIGCDILTVNRDLGVQELLQRVLSGETAEKLIDIAGGEYRLDASPVISNGTVSGAVILMFDVTEKEKAEQMRREFTANVSHELKTPLHAISGYAELLKSGIVKPGDINMFASNIYSEAQRMTRLIEDILRLSRLDEGADELKRERVDVYTLAEEAVKSLRSEAEQAGVEIVLKGESACIEGIERLVSGIIFNLCDNAIKYNRTGGTVTVSVTGDDSVVCLSVSDTGIGIPPQHQNRIFERFYRVDKSHSKEVGGTGLGLSIVKHAAKIHKAKIDLHSVPDEGTTVTVKFPVHL